MIVLDLKINSDLLNPNFNGYKLSLDPIGVHKIPLPAGVDQTFPSEDQYSFLYHKLFSLPFRQLCRLLGAEFVGWVSPRFTVNLFWR
ncbi:nudC domain-containing protein 1-like [Diaphorina citri]|uniref:NudC domain-containing protein 1-like n=1 Tax=Diaphorina citri TaxID=121845 RepID=A0A1S3DDJ1_DIACI|nr:nudC domain-containing protein 1-like [Diaphorina citri]